MNYAQRVILILLCIITSTSLFSQKDDYSLIKLHTNGFNTIQDLNNLDLDIDHYHSNEENTIEFYINHLDLETLKAAGFKYNVLIHNFTEYYNKRALADQDNIANTTKSLRTADHFGYGSMGGFYTLAEIEDKLDEMSADFPSLATPKFSIGTSIQGRTIWAVKISDNPNVAEAEEAVHFDALHHAREPLSMAVNINFAFWLLENYNSDPMVQYLVDNREIFFIPCVNPDGYEYNRATNPNGGGLWRKNRRDNGGGCIGVDLNRNYGFGYGFNDSCSSPNPCSNTYRGTNAFSEPESNAIKDLLAEHNPNTAFSIHSTAGSFLMPYGYDTNPPEYNLYSEWASDFLSENDYPYGVTAQMLGYTSCGGTRDWMHSQGIYGWTPEIDGSGFWPAQSEIFALVDENVYPMFYQAWISGQYTDVQSHSVIGEATAGGTFQINVEVKNKGLGVAPSDVSVALSSSNSDVSISGNGFVGNVPARTTANTSNFTISLNNGFSSGTVPITISVSQDGVETDQETISIPVGNKTEIFFDGAEAGGGNWSASGSGISWGVTQDDAYGGNSAFGDSDNGNSLNNTSNYYTLNTNLNLQSTDTPILEFFSKWSLETGDFVRVQVSTNGGSNWSTAKTFTSAEPWHQELIDLSAYKSANTRIRFFMDTDGSIPGDGFYFDQFSVSNYTCADCPVCTSSTNSFPYAESYETGLGEWTQGSDDNLNWTRDANGTPSNNTGPSSAFDGSWYMYIEASGNGTGYPYKTASLVSPCFDLSTATSANFAFQNHMYGSSSQMNLRLETSIDGGISWSTPIWQQTGNQGNQWNPESINLDAYIGEYLTLRFYGTTGETWQGDITVDDVVLTIVDGCTTTGDSCDDGNACTINDVIDDNCNCVGVLQDSDGDGICDADDQCPNFDDALIGTACNDNDACTTGDVWGTDCNCAGVFQDSDNDGICDANDPTNGDCTLNAPCNDNNDCTVNDVFDSNCNCAGTLLDDDNDGVCNNDDQCPGFDDNLIGTSCNDNDDCTTGDVWGTDCNCAGVFQDSDNDGICDANDPTNGDCTLNAACNDNDACTVNDVFDSNCNCSGTLLDDDNDGVCNNDDQCPGFDDNLIGTSCDDGDICTEGETWATDCNCSGGTLVDANNNGVCDFDETCGGSLPETESFESGLGTWTQGTDDDLNWTRDAGGTPSSGTGPSTGSDGSWYMYIEASGSGSGYPNKTASLVSDCFDIPSIGISTMEFDYHMWGSATTMNLIVQVSTDEGNSWSSAIWSVTGNQGNQWNAASIDLTPYAGTSINLRFFGTTGTTWQGDITIDAINIYTSAPCDLTGQSCDDGDNCTTGDVYDASCNCAGTYQDADSDGVCDNDDQCPGFDDTLIGTACDDGDPCYVGETWGTDCNCSGGTLLDNNNNGICDIDEGGVCTYVTIDFENFEGGYGIWNDGGSDCRRSINDSPFANSGTYCVRLRDNTFSSITRTDNLDLSSYDEIEINYTYITNSMETNEDFWLQISTNGGSTYTTIVDYDSGDEFVNNVREFESVQISGPFSSNTRIAFRCDASNNGDRVYIDDVEILACTINEEAQEASVDLRSNDQDYTFKYFPNPTKGNLFIQSLGRTLENEQAFTLYNLNGTKVFEANVAPTANGDFELDLSELSSGIYFISFVIDSELYKARVIKTE